ncbi:hypothetical protein [Streptomyces tateyamensis]|nr:hypothetical protein [Streptomyces tateyamensis]
MPSVVWLVLAARSRVALAVAGLSGESERRLVRAARARERGRP